MLNVDSKMLVDIFIYEEYIGGDEWGDDNYAVPQNITKARIDRSSVYSRDKTQTQIVADAIIFCYASATRPFIAFKERSRVTFDGRQCIIKKVVPVTDVYESSIWSYELEVM